MELHYRGQVYLELAAAVATARKRIGTSLVALVALVAGVVVVAVQVMVSARERQRW
jgi:hypothetical protein